MKLATLEYVAYVLNVRSIPTYRPDLIASPLYDVGCIIISTLNLLGLTKHNTLDNLLEQLKLLYINENIPSINLKYIEIKDELIKNINNNLLNNIIVTPASNLQIRKLVGQLIHYINLLMCINKYFYDHRVHFESDKDNYYFNLEFKDFIFFEVNNIKSLPNVDKMVEFYDERNYELLKRIVNETITRADNYNYF